MRVGGCLAGLLGGARGFGFLTRYDGDVADLKTFRGHNDECGIEICKRSLIGWCEVVAVFCPVAMQEFDSLLHGFAFCVCEVRVQQSGLVGKAVPVVGHNAAIARKGLKGTSFGARDLPAAIGFGGRFVGLWGSVARWQEVGCCQSGFRRNICGFDGSPDGSLFVILSEAKVFRECDQLLGAGLLCDPFVVPLIAEGMRVGCEGCGEGIPCNGDFVLALGAIRIDFPRGSAAAGKGMENAAGGLELSGGGLTAGEPVFHIIPECFAVVGGDAVDEVRMSLSISGELCGRDAGPCDAVCIFCLGAGNVLSFHLEGAVGIGGASVEEISSEARFGNCVARPEEGGEESDGAFEVAGVEEEGPALIAGGNVAAAGFGFGLSEGEREVAIAEPFSLSSLFEVESVRGPEYPGAKLSDCVLAVGFVPVSALSGSGAIGPFDKVWCDATHDEFGGFGGVFGVAPPAESAFDIGVHFFERFAGGLSKHPGAWESGLEALAGVMFEQWPCGDVHGEPGIEGVGHFFVGHEQIAGHFAGGLLLCGGGAGDGDCEGEEAEPEPECVHGAALGMFAGAGK